MARGRSSAAPKFHSEAAEEVYEFLEDNISKLHRDLDGFEPLILFKHNGWKSKGKVVFAKIKILGDDLRSTMGKDFGKKRRLIICLIYFTVLIINTKRKSPYVSRALSVNVW